jgi:protein TonB
LVVCIVSVGTPADALTLRPDWTSLPSQADIERAHPPRARANNVEGGAALDCAVTATGSLKDCQIISESPEGWGFGEATLKLAPLFALSVPPGRAQLERIRVPLKFRLPETK